jgi:hypothetical protein
LGSTTCTTHKFSSHTEVTPFANYAGLDFQFAAPNAKRIGMVQREFAAGSTQALAEPPILWFAAQNLSKN